MPRLLFNKANQGILELRPILTNLYASNPFDTISEFLVDATDKLILEISAEVYKVASDHYHSADYGTGATSEIELKDELVMYCQKPVALFGYLEYAPVNDIKDTGNGRRMHTDENSKLPFEWALDRQELHIYHRAHRAMDNLINFLDKNVDTFTVWADTDAYKKRQGLILRNTSDLDNVVPIEHSSWLFQKTIPFNVLIQKNHVRPVLKASGLEDLLANLPDALTPDQEEIIDELKNFIGYSIMAKVFRLLPVKFLPQGIVQQYTSDRNASAASQIAESAARIDVAEGYEALADREIKSVQEKLRKQRILAKGESYPEVKEPIDYDKQTFFRA